MMEERDEHVIGGQKDHAVFQIREALERGLDEIPTLPKFHLLFHRENLENERVHFAVINRLLGSIDRLQSYLVCYAGNYRPSFVSNNRSFIFFSFRFHPLFFLLNSRGMWNNDSTNALDSIFDS